MSLILLLLAQVAAAPPSPSRADVVVTGVRPEDTGTKLRECLARACPPREDVAASLAHVEKLFLSGDFLEARATAAKSLSRNRRYAHEMPIEISELARAKARLTDINGRPEAAGINTIDTLDILKDGLAADDARVFRQRLDVADQFARRGRFVDATGLYEKVIAQARRAGLPDVEGEALFRNAVLRAAKASVIPAAAPDARRAIARLANTTEPAFEPYRRGLTLMKAKLEKAVGPADATITAAPATTAPQLLYAPGVDVSGIASSYRPRPSVAPSMGLGTGDADTPWIDVQFMIDKDGVVRDAHVRKQSGNFDDTWRDPILVALKQRQYAPLILKPGTAGVTRVERYLTIGDYASELQSRIPIRRAPHRIEIIDLTG